MHSVLSLQYNYGYVDVIAMLVLSECTEHDHFYTVANHVRGAVFNSSYKLNLSKRKQ